MKSTISNYILSTLMVAFLGVNLCWSQTDRPNIIVILADDLGYGELGCYGQEIIETPNIDALAQEGMRFTQHYSGAPVCAPARCILLTGKHAGHAYIRGNDEWKERGDVWDYHKMYEDPGLEGQRPLPASEVTIGEVLQGSGYRTAFVGKWGLGAPGSEGTPNNQGFDYFFGYNCQRQAHTLYPGHLWENDERVYLDNELIAPRQKLPEDADPDDKASYDAFQLNEYAPDVMHKKALEFVESSGDEPFFMIYASPLPHLPLQAPERWVNHYRKMITDDPPYTGDRGYFPSYSPRATYAAMISALDEQVGELMDKLIEQGIDDNTIVMFTSDNGPTYTGGADTEYFDSAAPYSTAYGRGKGFLYEGGIRVPLIVRWPEMVAADTETDHQCAFYDYFQTIIDIADAQSGEVNDGLSFKNVLKGETQKTHEYLYWEQPEYGGQMALRMGDWKLVLQDIHKGNRKFELYQLEQDPQELFDLSDKYPERTIQLAKLIEAAHKPSEQERFSFPMDQD